MTGVTVTVTVAVSRAAVAVADRVGEGVGAVVVRRPGCRCRPVPSALIDDGAVGGLGRPR